MEAYIDEESLRNAGGEVTQSGIRIKDWEIQSTHGVMMRDSELDELRHRLGGILKTPEIVFGTNTVELFHQPSQFRIKFSAFDALQQWTEAKLPPLQLKFAEDWQRVRRQDIETHSPQILSYDWTFTSAYSGSLEPHGLNWKEVQDGIDLELLKRRDPILFYDSIPLYESELDDNGSCKFEVLVRVMEQFWFLIGRFFVRVDHHLVRLRETRLFSKFSLEGPVVVMRDRKHWECTMGQLEEQRSSTSDEIAGFGDIGSAAASLHSLFPNGTHLNLKETLQINPNTEIRRF